MLTPPFFFFFNGWFWKDSLDIEGCRSSIKTCRGMLQNGETETQREREMKKRKNEKFSIHCTCCSFLHRMHVTRWGCEYSFLFGNTRDGFDLFPVGGGGVCRLFDLSELRAQTSCCAVQVGFCLRHAQCCVHGFC